MFTSPSLLPSSPYCSQVEGKNCIGPITPALEGPCSPRGSTRRCPQPRARTSLRRTRTTSPPLCRPERTSCRVSAAPGVPLSLCNCMLPRPLLSTRITEPLGTAFWRTPPSRKLSSTSEIRLRSSPLCEALTLSSYRFCGSFAASCCSPRALLSFSVCASSSRARESITSSRACASFSWEPVLANLSAPPLEAAPLCCVPDAEPLRYWLRWPWSGEGSARRPPEHLLGSPTSTYSPSA
jgi:hypothetical protein